jgi:CBS domain-containing protein
MLRKIRDIMRDGEIAELPPTSTAQKAARLMLRTKRCATLIVSEGQLAGIVTEQDIVRRVVALGLDPVTTILSEIMTADPDTIGFDELAIKGLRMMEDGGYRHLPVVRGGRILGIVSRSDFPGDDKAELEIERHYWEAVG